MCPPDTRAPPRALRLSGMARQLVPPSPRAPVPSSCSTAGLAAPCARGPAEPQRQGPSRSAGSCRPLEAVMWARPGRSGRSGQWRYLQPRVGTGKPEDRTPGLRSKFGGHSHYRVSLTGHLSCGPAGAWAWGLRSSFKASSPVLSLLSSAAPSPWPCSGPCLGPAT